MYTTMNCKDCKRLTKTVDWQNSTDKKEEYYYVCNKDHCVHWLYNTACEYIDIKEKKKEVATL